MRDSFVFYRSFYEAIRDLPRDVQGEIYTAIMEYGLYGKETEQLKPIAHSMFILMKPILDANIARHENSLKGGAPKGVCNNPNGRRGKAEKLNQEYTENKPETNQEQTENKPRINQEQTTNIPNVNVDINVNNKEKELSNESPKKKKQGFDFSFISIEFLESFVEWLEYKKARKETYKTQASLKKCYENLLKLSNNNPEDAKQIIDQSIANNWAGLFALKPSSKVNIPSSQESVSNGLKIGKTERFENGKRTYGSGKANIPLDAPPRPGDGYSWNESNQQWVFA